MADDEGDVPKKGVDLSRLVVEEGKGAVDRAHERVEPMGAIKGARRALRNAPAPLTASQSLMKAHRAAFDVARAVPDVPEPLRKMRETLRMSDPAGTDALGEAHRSVRDAIGAESFAGMIRDQAVIAAVLPTLDVPHDEAVMRMLDGIHVHRSALQSAIGTYLDEQRTQAERISGMFDQLALPRLDPATLGMGSIVAFAQTNAFEIAGLTPAYADEFRSITDALTGRTAAVVALGSAVEASMPRPDLVVDIGSLLERALAQQAALLERQQELAEEAVDAPGAAPSQVPQQLAMIVAIVTILQFFMFVAIQIEERLSGGDAATTANTAAVEENTRMIEEMRGSFDGLADRLEEMRASQEAASEEERAADAAVAGLLREIADTLADQGGARDEPLDRPEGHGLP